MERYIPASYASVFLWAVAVLLGLIGLGRLVARAAGCDLAAKAGWGLHAVWGMAAYLFLGGFLALFGACTDTGIMLLIGAGLATMIWTTFRGGLPTKAAFAAVPWNAWPAFAVTALVFAGGLCWQLNVNPADDHPAYFNFCEKLRTTGSFDEPFSWRRLASLGGHTLLQCSVLARASYVNAQGFEVGLCPVILLGLVLGFRGGSLGRSPLGVFLGLVAATTPILRVNSASHLTGTVLLLGLFASLDLAERADTRRLRLLAAAGLVAAGLCSLRAQYVPAACGALGLFWLATWIRDRRSPRAALTEAGCWGASLLAGLLPWMIMSYRSNDSPLFPLFAGNNNWAFNPQGVDAPLHARMTLPVEMVFHPMLLPLMLCLLAAPDWRRGAAGRAVALAAVLTSFALAYSINLAPDEFTVPRYVQPLLLAGALAVLMAAAVSPRTRLMAWALGGLFVATSLAARSQALLNHYAALAQPRAWKAPFRAQTIADYRKAQALIPEGQRILVAGDFPFLFDHRRNPIWIIDMPNGACPPPGLPFQKPAEETKRYLRSLGVEYFIFTDFATSVSEIYSRSIWQKHAQGDVALFRIQAPFYLDFFDTAERLAASETVLGRVGDLTVVQFKP